MLDGVLELELLDELELLLWLSTSLEVLDFELVDDELDVDAEDVLGVLVLDDEDDEL